MDAMDVAMEATDAMMSATTPEELHAAIGRIIQGRRDAELFDAFHQLGLTYDADKAAEILRLLDAGANPCVYFGGSNRMTAFHLAAMQTLGYVDAILLPMLDRLRDGRISAAAYTQRDCYGQTAFQLYLEYLHPTSTTVRVIRAFVEAGFDVNAPDGHLRPTLWYVVKDRKTAVIQAFLDAGAAPIPASFLERSEAGLHYYVYEVACVDGHHHQCRWSYELTFAHDARGCLLARALPPEMTEIVLTVATRVPMRYIRRLVAP